MTEEPSQMAAGHSAFQTVQADDPAAPHDLTIVLRCATEQAAYDILMSVASKMHLQCSGMDNLPDNRSLPLAGTQIDLLTRGASPQNLGSAIVSVTT